MKPCPCCQRTVVGLVIGVQWNHLGTAILGVAHNCICGTTRVAPWADVPEEIRTEAVLAEKARPAVEGAI